MAHIKIFSSIHEPQASPQLGLPVVRVEGFKFMWPGRRHQVCKQDMHPESAGDAFSQPEVRQVGGDRLVVSFNGAFVYRHPDL